MIDLKALKPNKVSYDWHKQTIAIFAPPKFGKSTFMHELLGQEALFIATEDGHDAIPGIISQRVYSVSDIKEVIWQLQDMVEAGECPFKAVVFDTVDNLETMIQKYVISQAGVQDMGDVGHGKLYIAYDKQLLSIINDLKALKIGVHFIGHVKQKKVEDKINKVEYEKFMPSVAERTQKIILSDAYFMPFIFNKLGEDGSETRMMAFRDTFQWLSGSIN